ncbi:hypothetical protein PSYJA_45061, partial [Pseudomonas syringae pv. japonica str. M301072]
AKHPPAESLQRTAGNPYLQYALFPFDSRELLHNFAQAL